MGSQVLGVYVQQFYYQSSVLAIINYVSIVFAVMIYGVILKKFIRSRIIRRADTQATV